MKVQRVYISCGGTGGHFYPGLSIARELKNRSCEVELLLSGVNSAAQSRQAAFCGIRAVVLPRMPSPGKNPLRLLLFLLGLAGGFIRTFGLFLFRRPEYIIIMGSFASAPGALAAGLLFVPVYLHDGNARIGKANRLLSRMGRFLGTAFPAVNASACGCEVICTGMPIRPELEQKCRITKGEAISQLNKEYNSSLREDLYTLLIFGGSQGAATFNKNLPEGLKQLSDEAFQVIHLTGKGKLEETLQRYENLPFPRLVLESSPLMELFLGSADLVFSRSGGSSVAELALFGKNAVLIPYPYAAEDHQNDNASFYVDSGAGEKISDSEFTPEKALEMVKKHIQNPALGAERSKKALHAAYPRAAETFLDLVAQKQKKKLQ